MRKVIVPDSPPRRAGRLPPVLLPLLASALAWGILCVVLPPAQQDFPLGDDWAFAHGAFRFARGEPIDYVNWASMPQLGQWLWACPFIWLLGQSFFALRVSTIILSWVGLWAFYDLLRQEGLSAGRAAFATAVLGLNPLFFLLQGTFMTDVPSLSLSLAALALYGRGLANGRLGWLVGACVVASLAAATRQNTVAVSLAAALWLWRQSERRRQPMPWLTILVPALVGVSVHFWFQARPDVIAVEPRPLPPESLTLLPFFALHLCGLAVLPVLPLSPPVGSWRAFAAALGLMSLAALYWHAQGELLPFGGLFPYSDALVTPWGAGSGHLVDGSRPLLLGRASRLALTVLGCLGGALLLTRMVHVKNLLARPGLLVLFSMGQMPFLVLAPDLWDRYLLALLPGVLLLTAASQPGETASEKTGLRLLPALALLAVFGCVSAGLMHDWLAWNAARWELGRRALRHGIPPCDIEGGFEWDGWFAPKQAPQRRSWRDFFTGDAPGTREPRALTLVATRRWFPHVTGRFALSFSNQKDGVFVDSEPYRLWLLPGNRRFYLLQHKVTSAPAGSP